MISVRTNKKFALFFFIVGTMLFIIQLLTREINMITVIGYFYVGASIIINSIVVLILLFQLINYKRKKETLTSIGLILINLPIAFVYSYLVVNYLI